MTAFSKFRQHPETYEARFKNAQGERLISVYNDGERLQTEINGFSFAGLSFSELEAESPVPVDGSMWPWVWHEEQSVTLVNFEVSFDFHVDMYVNEILTPCTLGYSLTSKFRQGLDGQANSNVGAMTQISIQAGHEVLWKSRWQESLEQALAERPESLRLRTCFGCALSDYNPDFAGHSDGFRLTCFRNVRELYKDLSTRPGAYKECFWVPYRECRPPAENVHELDVCPEFEIRKPGTGYRK